MTLPVQIGDAKTWIEAFVVPGSTPHLISRRWLSQHRCVVNFDPNNLCLESPEFGSVPLVLHSSGHLLLSLVSPSNPVDQYTVMIDYQNSPSSVVNNFQKCNEQIMDSLQSRNQIVDKRAEPDEKRAGNSTLVRRRSNHPVEFAVHLDDPNEEITEQWQDGLHESSTSVETISAQSSPTESPVMSPRCEAANPCVRVSNAGPSPSAQTVKYRRHVNVTPTVPQENLLPCFHRSHQLLPGSNAVSVYLTCLDCRHHAKWTHRTGPTFQQFPELQQMVQAWWTKLQRRRG